MKNFTKKFLIVAALLSITALKAQIGLIVGSPNPCGMLPASLNMSLTANVPTATGYVWSVLAANATSPNTFTVGSVTNSASINLPVTGAYTITVFPYNISNVLLTGQIVSTTYSLSSAGFNISMSTSSNTLCAGSSATLTANGAVSYTWSNGSTGPQLVVTPTASTCYSVIGNIGGCLSSNVSSSCITLLTGVNLIATASTSYVCKGSSASLSVSGAQTYTWNPGSIGTNFTVMPVTTTVYTVTGTNANGCTGTATVPLLVDSTCAMVWPGDANSDGFVSTLDVLELGLQAGYTGSARTAASNNFTAQYATTWAGTISNGKNRCHADCDGNGTVNANDTVAIFNNFNLIHSFKPHPQAASDEITFQFNKSAVEIGRWNTLDIYLGSAIDQVQCLGASFEISFEPSKLAADSIWIEFVNSSFSTNNQYLYFRKTNFSNGTVFAAISRTDALNKNYNERIAVLHFKTSPTLSNSGTINFGLNSALKMTANGAVVGMVGDSRNLSLTKNLTSLDSQENEFAEIKVYPSPTKDIITIHSANTKTYHYKLFDLSGRLLIDSEFTSDTKINVETFENGIYLLELISANGVNAQRITVMH